MMSKQNTADSAEVKPFRLRIMDKEVQISCREGEEEDLAKAAAYVDQTMRELRQKNASSSIEKIAIVTAINTANGWLKSASGDNDDTAMLDQIASMNAKLEALLDEN